MGSKVFRRGLLLAVLLGSTRAAANPEVDAYDARAVGMAGSGMIENGAAIFQNPAAMHATDHLSVTVVASPILGWARAPLDGNGTSQSAGPSFSPLFLVGANVRLFDRLVVGAISYPASGYGASFSQPKGTPNAEVSAVVTAAALGASFAILPNLAVGGALDASWASERLQNYESTTGTVSGHTFVGGQLGLYWRPAENLHFGFAWRSKTVTDVAGSSTLSGVPVYIQSKAATPNSFKLGAQIGVLDDRLVLAFGLAYWMYAAADGTVPLTATANGATLPLETVYDWNDSYAGVAGGEWWITKRVPIRAGVAVTRSATPYAKPSAFFPPPGWITSLATGTGLRLDHWQFDLGVAYSFDTANVTSPTQDPPQLGSIAAPTRYSGEYAFHDVLVSVAGTFAF